MVEELAKDYASYCTKSAIADHQVAPILSSIELMLHRLDEFEHILTNTNQEASHGVRQHIPAILERQSEFEQLFAQIESLERFVDVADHTISTVEETVNRADEELGCNSLGIKGLLLRGKKWATDAVATGSAVTGSMAASSSQTAAVMSPVFKAPEVFRSYDYFCGTTVNLDENLKNDK